MLISPFEPFPMLSWWRRALHAGTVCLDLQERYDKAGFRNQYLLAGPQGAQLMSIPLVGGRDQKPPMRSLRICDAEPWQIRQLRTIRSLYNNAPFFEHYADALEALFQQQTYLWQFSEAGIKWLIQVSDLPVTISEISAERRIEAQTGDDDLRRVRKQARRDDVAGLPTYTQVFADRTPFLPNLSALDMLFCEGPGWWRQLKDQPAVPR